MVSEELIKRFEIEFPNMTKKEIQKAIENLGIACVQFFKLFKQVWEHLKEVFNTMSAAFRKYVDSLSPKLRKKLFFKYRDIKDTNNWRKMHRLPMRRTK